MSDALGADFEDELREAVLDDAERRVRDEIGPRLIAVARENWDAYASRHGYDIGHIPDEAELSFERTATSIEARIEWPGLTALFEWGVGPHTIRGSPLHFYWEEKEQWVQTDEVDWGSETGGISEARAIRDALERVGGRL